MAMNQFPSGLPGGLPTSRMGPGPVPGMGFMPGSAPASGGGSGPGFMFPGGTADNPMAMGMPGPPMVPVPINSVRMGTAQSMDMMRQNIAPITVVADVDVSNLKALHDWIKPSFEAQMGIALTYTPFFARATAVALQAVPIMNSIFSPQGHMVSRTVNLGIATQVPGGVMIPTIVGAEHKTIPDLAREIATIGQRARAGQLTPLDSIVASFVMTNTGKFGETMFGTPTIKPPNVGILAFEAIKKRAVALENDEIVARPVMHLALTADHRAVDGAEMAAFIGKVKQVLENLAF
ncbi:MAG: hypothetical protein JWN15_1725 [Firmicutes bacterium]|nr:hypothetical protein [Bacillota bacterium]